MRRATWVVAILVDVVGVALGFLHFIAEPQPLIVFWGAVQIGLFAALIAFLVRPRLVADPAHYRLVTRVFCFSLPAAALVGSLDSGTISGLEWVAIVVAGLIAALNWVALSANAVAPLPRAA